KGRKLVVSEARPPKPRGFDNGNGGGNRFGRGDDFRRDR
ncbi:RNA-binding protein, partial [Candidatus Woesearchaeota archaeon]|nr:RNA-binding protein [Candidatus Woesearchaeota archaeon]